jgi:hypothetical protein
MVILQNKLEYEDDVDIVETLQIREELGWRERKEAEFLRTIGKGVMLVTGNPGSGKDLFAVSISYLNKYYFGRRVMLDFRPKIAFGEYSLFNVKVMMQEIEKMAKEAQTEGASDEETDKIVVNASEKFIERNEVLFQGAVIYLSELKRYCYNRNPHNPVNKFVGSLCTVWRHLDCLIIGTHVQKHEIDRYSFLEYVTHWAKCSWSLTRPDTTDVTITRGAFIGASGVYDVAAKPIILHVDGGKSRSLLEGKRFYDLYPTKNMVNLKPVIRKEI